MDAKVSDIPVRINVPEPPLRGLPLLQMLVKNPIGVWPASVYREPFVRWRVFARDIVFVNAPSLIREVLVDQADAFEKGELIRRALQPALGEGILTADGARWRWQRRATAPIFRPDRIVSFVPAMVEAAERTKQRWLSLPPGSEVNIAQEMMHATFEVILSTMFAGGAEMDVTRIEQAITHYLESIGWITAVMMMRAPAWTPYPGRLKASRARDYLRSTLFHLLRGGHKGGDNDLLAQLTAAKDPETGQSMNVEELVDNLLTFITAGHETTAVALTWTFYLLSLHPNVEQRVVEEIERITNGEAINAAHVEALAYTRQVVLEAMRLYPPVPVVPRTPVREVTIGGEAIPPGVPVYIPIYAVHRHAALWEDVDRFDPERFRPEAVKGRDRYAYLPFGAGPRICIGMTFAMSEAVAILATLVRSVRLKVRAGHVPEFKMRATLRPAAGMPMTVAPR